MSPRKIRLTRIDDPHPRLHTIVEPDPVPVSYTADKTAPDLVCAECQEVLITGIQRNHLPPLVVRCPSCGIYNDTA